MSLLMTCLLLIQLAVAKIEALIVSAVSFGSGAFLCCLKVMVKLL